MKKRCDGRKADGNRKIKIKNDYLAHPAASVLIEVGGTKVICAVTVEPGVPGWMRAQNVPGGWLTCEYGMLPSSTHDRGRREASRGKQGGRTMEIQRLIGRSLRSVLDLQAIGANTIYIDCDVIDADGGTRCASITGASVALNMALNRLMDKKAFKNFPMKENIAAVSVGIVDGEVVLDLCYEEDSSADVDMNIVMTESGKFVEIQGTAEENPFSEEEMMKMLSFARKGLEGIFEIQRDAIGKHKGHGKSGRGGKFGNIGEMLGDVKV